MAPLASPDASSWRGDARNPYLAPGRVAAEAALREPEHSPRTPATQGRGRSVSFLTIYRGCSWWCAFCGRAFQGAFLADACGDKVCSSECAERWYVYTLGSDAR